jgi:hypothetical protein
MPFGSELECVYLILVIMSSSLWLRAYNLRRPARRPGVSEDVNWKLGARATSGRGQRGRCPSNSKIGNRGRLPRSKFEELFEIALLKLFDEFTKSRYSLVYPAPR